MWIPIGHGEETAKSTLEASSPSRQGDRLTYLNPLAARVESSIRLMISLMPLFLYLFNGYDAKGTVYLLDGEKAKIDDLATWRTLVWENPSWSFVSWRVREISSNHLIENFF